MKEKPSYHRKDGSTSLTYQPDWSLIGDQGGDKDDLKDADHTDAQKTNQDVRRPLQGESETVGNMKKIKRNLPFIKSIFRQANHYRRRDAETCQCGSDQSRE